MSDRPKAAPSPMIDRRPTMLFSISTPLPIRQPSAISELETVAPSQEEGGRKRARV